MLARVLDEPGSLDLFQELIDVPGHLEVGLCDTAHIMRGFTLDKFEELMGALQKISWCPNSSIPIGVPATQHQCALAEALFEEVMIYWDYSGMIRFTYWESRLGREFRQSSQLKNYLVSIITLWLLYGYRFIRAWGRHLEGSSEMYSCSSRYLASDPVVTSFPSVQSRQCAVNFWDGLESRQSQRYAIMLSRKWRESESQRRKFSDAGLDYNGHKVWLSVDDIKSVIEQMERNDECFVSEVMEQLYYQEIVVQGEAARKCPEEEAYAYTPALTQDDMCVASFYVDAYVETALVQTEQILVPAKASDPLRLNPVVVVRAIKPPVFSLAVVAIETQGRGYRPYSSQAYQRAVSHEVQRMGATMSRSIRSHWCPMGQCPLHVRGRKKWLLPGLLSRTWRMNRPYLVGYTAGGGESTAVGPFSHRQVRKMVDEMKLCVWKMCPDARDTVAVIENHVLWQLSKYQNPEVTVQSVSRSTLQVKKKVEYDLGAANLWSHVYTKGSFPIAMHQMNGKLLIPVSSTVSSSAPLYVTIMGVPENAVVRVTDLLPTMTQYDFFSYYSMPVIKIKGDGAYPEERVPQGPCTTWEMSPSFLSYSGLYWIVVCYEYKGRLRWACRPFSMIASFMQADFPPSFSANTLLRLYGFSTEICSFSVVPKPTWKFGERDYAYADITNGKCIVCRQKEPLKPTQRCTNCVGKKKKRWTAYIAEDENDGLW